MKKLTLSDYTGQQLVDVRTQHEYQKGYVKHSINLNPENFKKYASYYLDTAQPIVFIVGTADQEALEDLFTAAEVLGFSQIEGYLLADEWPKEELKELPIIPAEDFLALEDDYILLDVRHPDEITRPAPEKNLVNLPFEDIIGAAPNFDKNTPIYTLCGSGNRSTAAASYLTSQGFRAAVVEGGMKAVQEKQNNN